MNFSSFLRPTANCSNRWENDTAERCGEYDKNVTKKLTTLYSCDESIHTHTAEKRFMSTVKESNGLTSPPTQYRLYGRPFFTDTVRTGSLQASAIGEVRGQCQPTII